MAELKTKPSKASVKKFIDAVENETRRGDAKVLLKLFERVTGEKAVLWGDSIVGFGSYHYKSTRSSQEGDWLLTGFSARKASMTVYMMDGFKGKEAQLKKLGKHKHSVSCLYINKLADIDLKVLEKLIRDSYKFMKTEYKHC